MAIEESSSARKAKGRTWLPQCLLMLSMLVVVGINLKAAENLVFAELRLHDSTPAGPIDPAQHSAAAVVAMRTPPLPPLPREEAPPVAPQQPPQPPLPPAVVTALAEPQLPQTAAVHLAPPSVSVPAVPVATVEPIVPAMYGGDQDLQVIGMDTCSAFLAGPHRRGIRLLLGPAGLFNTGTNLMETLLRKNCKLPGGTAPASTWQVPWGKHNPVQWRGHHYAPTSKGVNVSHVMPVMMVKDPLTWMTSMCRHPYAARFRQGPRCPSPLGQGKVTVAWQPTRHYSYASLVHLWSQWNRAYLDAAYPRLIVRYEDLLFRPEETVTRVCKCVGGQVNDPPEFVVASASAKSGPGHGDGGSDRTGALKTYSSREKRERPYSAEDRAFIVKSWDAELASLLRYKPPLPLPTNGTAAEWGERRRRRR